MKALRLAYALVVCVGLTPMAAAKEPQLTERPAETGNEVSQVTTYEMKSSSGFAKQCSGKCFSDGVTRFWTCKSEGNEIAHCFLRCSPPPVKTECLFE